MTLIRPDTDPWSLTDGHVCDMCSTSDNEVARRNCGRQLPATKGDIEDLYRQLVQSQRTFLDEIVDMLAESLRCKPIRRDDQ